MGGAETSWEQGEVLSDALELRGVAVVDAHGEGSSAESAEPRGKVDGIMYWANEEPTFVSVQGTHGCVRL